MELTSNADIEILYDKSLCFGAYGKVYMAKIGPLKCVVKLFHDSLFNARYPARLDRLYNYLNSITAIKHPCIIQHIGVYLDAHLQRPVLFMELMDENLNTFLKKTTQALSNYHQLHLCYDIALALSYLHSNNIIHGDLNGNNVLLTSDGAKAKVADFGMFVLNDAHVEGAYPKIIPGPPQYMAPEAIKHSLFTTKLDSFSFGVISIQILTRKFPDPGEAQKIIESPIPPYLQEIVFDIPEVERRKNHLDLISQYHPLILLIIACIDNRHQERPEVDAICKKLEDNIASSYMMTRPERTLLGGAQWLHCRPSVTSISDGLSEIITERRQGSSENQGLLENRVFVPERSQENPDQIDLPLQESTDPKLGEMIFPSATVS